VVAVIWWSLVFWKKNEKEFEGGEEDGDAECCNRVMEVVLWW